jgi:hypothetical protein
MTERITRTRYTCSVCGRITAEPRCPDHPPRDKTQQAHFRARVLERDGYRCRFCGATEDLRAAHWPVPLRALSVQDGQYDPRRGVTVCRDCDKKTDPYVG